MSENYNILNKKLQLAFNLKKEKNLKKDIEDLITKNIKFFDKKYQEIIKNNLKYIDD